MKYFTKADLEPFVGRMIVYVAYCYPLGTDDSGTGRYFEEYEEVTLTKITDRCLVCLSSYKTAAGDAVFDEILVPIDKIVCIRFAVALEPTNDNAEANEE